MLTDAGYEERTWGPFPALRRILKDKRLSNGNWGNTSVSDDMFARIQRTLEIALLACEYESDIRSKAASGDPMEMDNIVRDLQEVCKALGSQASFIDNTLHRVEHLSQTL